MRTYGRYLKDLFIASYSFPPRSFVRATTKYTIHRAAGGTKGRRDGDCFDKAPNALNVPPSLPTPAGKVSKSGPTAGEKSNAQVV